MPSRLSVRRPATRTSTPPRFALCLAPAASVSMARLTSDAHRAQHGPRELGHPGPRRLPPRAIFPGTQSS
nr:hypothetical protein CFP56_00523 [Quercus suber]